MATQIKARREGIGIRGAELLNRGDSGRDNTRDCSIIFPSSGDIPPSEFIILKGYTAERARYNSGILHGVQLHPYWYTGHDKLLINRLNCLGDRNFYGSGE